MQQQQQPTTNKENYCGFVCSDIIDRQQAIINDIKDFSNYNPEFALVMLGRIIDISYNARLELPKRQNTTPK